MNIGSNTIQHPSSVRDFFLMKIQLFLIRSIMKVVLVITCQYANDLQFSLDNTSKRGMSALVYKTAISHITVQLRLFNVLYTRIDSVFDK